MPNIEENKDKHNILLSSADISKRVIELGSSISEYYGDGEVTILALANGAVIFAADLIRHIRCPMRLDTFAVASYENQKSSEKLHFRSEPKLNIAGHHVLIVDDILDTGLTLTGVKNWLEEQGVKSVRICVLLDKQVASRKADISADWYGFKIPDTFVYGYGLDKDEFLRNLPFVAQLADQ